ncbi:DNA polymerase [Streptomyces sp. NBC_01500]|uniref:DNA polymerase n=1 Tax=Streptomyces sp. NBC_01500 TaxID=2903886 RepID=UPI00224D8952|nr:DNA polymerase [Streptomyces sp. NBC_01500]MCX4547262.1 DNA polymerase [Streptomyces sp. NBC_01500]MCX4554182.1 DNA polymerase [Streptomyces sp. NBC_01500]MCX4554522.1 DNA polymerase [Streptomyces sp. NBC_01500]
MKTFPYAIAGDPVAVKVPETVEDLEEFKAWIVEANKRGPIALDTETTGLDIYSPTYGLRTVQFGDRRTGWVILWELGGYFQHYARRALDFITRFQIHNAPFDWAVMDRHASGDGFDGSIEAMAPKTIDTRLKAGLVDPRQPQEGGRGTALKPLMAYYVDPAAPDTAGDLTAVFRSLKLTKATGWAGIDLWHPTYLLYAGLDPIFAARLDSCLDTELSNLGVRPRLIEYEHEIARICAVMQRKGMVLDVPYTQRLDGQLAEEAAIFEAKALRYGVANVNAPAQLREALQGMGEEWQPDERTATGALKVDKAVLHRFADMDLQGNRLSKRKPNPLAEAIIKSKRAGKWRSAYTGTFLETMDSEGRIHPFINSMIARTGRMSVTRPALQTLPSGDYMIRRALLAEEGHVMISTDFSAVELRVLAALADVKQMKHAINAGEDLHSFTARMVFGEDFTPKHRKISKGIAFGKVYGGGAATIQRQTGAPMDEVKRALAAYDRVYPEVKRMSNRWQREAYETGMVHLSVTGRRLPLDRDRMYAVVNYACQSVARDCLGQSLINLEARGMLPHLRLPIHDEVLASAPKGEATDIARTIKECMTFDLFGVPIEAEAEIGKRSWGSLYGADV